MTIKNTIKQFNILLAGDNLTPREVLPHLDFAIDRINEQLNTTYPTFSDVYEANSADEPAYDYFEDRYIRTVVCVGAAWHYYVTDEEGLATAAQYQQDFENALFRMMRDTLYDIPEEYRNSDEAGTVRAAVDHWSLGDRGLETFSGF